MSGTVIIEGGRPAQFNGTRSVENLPFSCRCGVRWSGTRTCHCGSCHRSMSGVTTFERHRRDGHCLDPATVGMSLMPGRSFECWGYPGDTQTDTSEPVDA